MRLWVAGPRILGRRTGFSLGPEDLRAFRQATARQGTASSAASLRPPSFIYVIKSEAGHVKVGITADPLARLNTLQTASASRLELAYCAVPKSNNALAIEQTAHAILANHCVGGEWFAVVPELAVAAISAASFKFHDPIVEIPINQISTVLAIAAAQDRAGIKPKRRWSMWNLCLIGVKTVLGAICGGIIFAAAMVLYYIFIGAR